MLPNFPFKCGVRNGRLGPRMTNSSPVSTSLLADLCANQEAEAGGPPPQAEDPPCSCHQPPGGPAGQAAWALHGHPSPSISRPAHPSARPSARGIVQTSSCSADSETWERRKVPQQRAVAVVFNKSKAPQTPARS